MTYTEFVSQFEIFDNPPIKKGYERHHIVPESEQVKMYGSVIDERQIYVTPAQHLWCHILYDRENGTKTADLLLKLCGKSAEYFDCWEKVLAYSYTLSKKRFKNHSEQSLSKISAKSKEYWSNEDHRQKLSDKCREAWTSERRQRQSEQRLEAYKNGNLRQQISDSVTELWKDSNYRNKHCGENHWPCSGKNNPMYGTISPVKDKHWFNNGIKSIMAYECPEGFVPGRLMKQHC